MPWFVYPFLATGRGLEDTPTISLEELQDNQTIRHTVRRLPPDTSDTALEIQDEREYSPLEKDVLFFDNSAFSRSSIQVTPGSEFGTELGSIARDRRLRLVQEFDRTGCLDRLTLIREKRAGATTVERPPLSVDDLLGE